jgi:hypothetical protein
LDTFPDTLFINSGRNPTGLDVSAALISSSRTKDQILDLRNTASKLLPLDERESVYNDLSQMAQCYSIGWESGSDMDGDDE